MIPLNLPLYNPNQWPEILFKTSFVSYLRENSNKVEIYLALIALKLSI